MSGPNPKRQKAAWAAIDRLFNEAGNCWVIHYSCESFYDLPEGRSPRITSLALRKLDSGQTRSFSIHQVAERSHIAFADIEQHYDELERQMLDEFYGYIGGHLGMKYIHWNMRDINYGFAALEQRYRVLGGNPLVVDEEKKFDLARLLIDIYGVGYAGHPRLESVLKINDIKPLNFMPGAEEAAAFEQKNFVGLHQSTLRKVDVIANLLGRTHDRSLKTNTTLWEMHGGRVRSFVNWLGDNKVFTALAGVASIVGLAIAVWTLRG